jgi:hypothetical protein
MIFFTNNVPLKIIYTFNEAMFNTQWNKQYMLQETNRILPLKINR